MYFPVFRPERIPIPTNGSIPPGANFHPRRGASRIHQAHKLIFLKGLKRR